MRPTRQPNRAPNIRKSAVCTAGLCSGQPGNPSAMLIRKIARPLLSAVFIGQGAETLRNPKVAAHAAEPSMAAMRTLPDPVATKVPADPEVVARINAAIQLVGGV